MGLLGFPSGSYVWWDQEPFRLFPFEGIPKIICFLVRGLQFRGPPSGVKLEVCQLCYVCVGFTIWRSANGGESEVGQNHYLCVGKKLMCVKVC